MDLNQQQQRMEIEQFLLDVRAHIRASLETSEYENTSNIFHVTEAQSSLQLLQKCEQLLEKFADKNHNNVNKTCNGKAINGNDYRLSNQQPIKMMSAFNKDVTKMSNGNHEERPINGLIEDACYLDMTATKKISDSKEYIAFNNSADSDKTFRCSTRNADQRTSIAMLEGGHATTDDDEDDSDDGDDGENGPQIYDICQVTQIDPDEVQKSIKSEHDQTLLNDCPYMDLPAGHLAIQKSAKFGQLQRIEKRLFFDQSKKCYCGILNDWLLCYTDGPTASRPNITLHLKNPGIEIEHSGEGKRREVCFQITTADPSKKFVFQANNEVDAKEWIHAIEAAIRGDSAAGILKNSRKLPTPPVMKKLTFVSSCGKSEVLNTADGIYEEPSPLYHIHEPTELLISNIGDDRFKLNGDGRLTTDLSEKLNNSTDIAKKYEYDIPKSPPQPFKLTEQQTELETAGLLNSIEPSITASTLSVPTTSSYSSNSNISPQRPLSRSAEKMDFQTKIKDVHSKLSSQLLGGGPIQKKSSKKSYVATSTNEVDSTTLLTASPSPPSTKEQKKQKKSSTSSLIEQKTNNSNATLSAEKAAKNWFLNRLNKTTSSTRSSTSSVPSPAKCKQSEKENLLNNLEMCDNYEGSDSNPTSPILKSSSVSVGSGSGGGNVGSGKSKVNMIINQFETSGHMAMFSMETLAGSAAATFSAFCESDCNNYEPIMTIATPPSSFMKKV